jgi:predicted ABC-type ATPase
LFLSSASGHFAYTFFVELSHVELAIRRVADRVSQGGHNVPEAVIRRRFTAGRRHFEEIYKPLVTARRHHDNSGEEPRLLAASILP